MPRNRSNGGEDFQCSKKGVDGTTRMVATARIVGLVAHQTKEHLPE